MSSTQNFREIGFPIPFNYRRGIDYTAYQISSLNISKGNESSNTFNLGGSSWPGTVITGSAYYEDRDAYREYLWVERRRNTELPWPPDKNLLGNERTLIKPAPMEIPYGLDVEMKPIPANCEGKNFATPFIYTSGSADLNQCLWQVARSEEGIEIQEDPTSFVSVVRIEKDPIPLSISGEWDVIWSIRPLITNNDEWKRIEREISSSTEWRIAKFIFSVANPAPPIPTPVSDLLQRKIRIGYYIDTNTIELSTKILPDRNPLYVELRALIPPSTDIPTLYAEVLIPNEPKDANIQLLYSQCEVVDVGRSVLWHDREIITTVGSDAPPTIKVKGKNIITPKGSSITNEGIVDVTSSWVYSDGFDSKRTADPIWIIADILTRSVHDYNDDTIDWASFKIAGEDNFTPINKAISIQSGPLETLAPILSETRLQLFQEKGIWTFRTGLRMLLGSNQIIGVPSVQTPTIRTPSKVTLTWGEIGWAELSRKYPDVPTIGEDIIPWSHNEDDALRDAREQLWPQQNVIMDATIGPMGALLEVGDILAVDITAPSIRHYEKASDGSYILTLSDYLPSYHREVNFMVDVEEVSTNISVEPLLEGKLKAVGIDKEPTLRAAIVGVGTQRWEVLSISKRSVIEYNTTLQKRESDARKDWIENGSEGCERIQDWTRSILDWPEITSCGGFSL